MAAVMQGGEWGFLFEEQSGNASLGRPLCSLKVSQNWGRGERIGKRKGKEGKGTGQTSEGCPIESHRPWLETDGKPGGFKAGT